MIFLTIGTWHKGFDRLVKAVDELASRGAITEGIVAQIGYGTYRPQHAEVVEFCSPAQFADWVEKASVVISHAGVGTMVQAIQCGKPLVVVPRRKELGEVSNDHQFNTARQFEDEGKVLVAYDVDELPARLEQAKGFIPRRDDTSAGILVEIQRFIDEVKAKKRERPKWLIKDFWSVLWPYQILRRDDDGIKADLVNIMDHYTERGVQFDIVVFIPNAGHYLSKLFVETFGNSPDIGCITVRRASTIAKTRRLKQVIFRTRWLADMFRHLEVLLRFMKLRLGIRQKMAGEAAIEFDATGKHILIIDDSVDTGTTMTMVKSALLRSGASSVTTACISNHLAPDRVHVDYAVYRYRLLRTRNSRDYQVG